MAAPVEMSPFWLDTCQLRVCEVCQDIALQLEKYDSLSDGDVEKHGTRNNRKVSTIKEDQGRSKTKGVADGRKKSLLLH